MNLKLQFTYLFILFLSFSLQAQTSSLQFGQVKIGDFNVSNKLTDKDAEAVVLFDLGKNSFDYRSDGFNVIFERTTRIQILSEAGHDYAEVEIPFYTDGKDKEKVLDIQAYSYNMVNGEIQKTPMNPLNVYTETVNNYWSIEKFALPNVQPGTIIEYKYTVRSPNVFKLREWRFQWKIPVLHSAYEVRMTPYYSYVYIVQGTDRFDDTQIFTDRQKKVLGNQEYYEKVFQFLMKDVPAFKSEDFITTIDDYIIKVNFQLAEVNDYQGRIRKIVTTWDELAQELLYNKNFGTYLKQSKSYAKKVIPVDSLKKLDDLSKFDYVLDYVKGNYNWDGILTKFTDLNPSGFADKKVGNVAEINLFTIGLLNAVGIDAKPVLISTRKNGKIVLDYPLASYFNYVAIIAPIDGRTILSDATEANSINARLPLRSINDKGFIVDKKENNWVALEFSSPSEIRNSSLIELNDDLQIQTKTHLSATEYDALYLRNQFTEKGWTGIKNELKEENLEWIDAAALIQNEKDRDKALILRFEQEGKAEHIGQKVYISPFLEKSEFHNPLKEEVRNYPVDLGYPIKRSYQTLLNFPVDYEVDFIPENKTYDNDLFQFSYETQIDGNQIKVDFTYAFKKAIYPPDVYRQVQSFFKDLEAKGSDKIVVIKKSQSLKN